MEGLVLVAPSEGRPFATGPFQLGSGEAKGVSLDLVGAGARFGLLATWGWQQVRLRSPGLSWVPVHGSRHLLDGGVVLFPTATSELKLGATALLGRRATAVAGSLEWESCNLLDEGCEFGGSPEHGGEPLGGAELPAYVRVDVGLRKHWHVEVAGRDALLGLFGTLSNVFGRENVLNWARDPVSGERVGIEMRRVAPLLIGLDWRF
jgi:hypothetical protein